MSLRLALLVRWLRVAASATSALRTALTSLPRTPAMKEEPPAAEKKAVSERMTAYWAERRKKTAKK